MTKIFYDFEFQENGSTILPISLGVVAENNQELYFVNNDFMRYADDPESPYYASDWVRGNVLPNIYYSDSITSLVNAESQAWADILYNWLLDNFPLLQRQEQWQFIGYYADYDHVALAQLWGDMMQLPIGMPLFSRDIAQWMKDLSLVESNMPAQDLIKHNAVIDARWNKAAYEFLVANYQHPAWSQSP